MNEPLPLLLNLAIGCAAGIALGAVFFGGLWLTARRLIARPHPGLLALLSLVGRMAVLGFGMFLVAQFKAASPITTLLLIQIARDESSTAARQGFHTWQ